MRRFWQLLLALFVAAAISFTGATAIRADNGPSGQGNQSSQSQAAGTASPSNQAVAINTKNNSSIFKFAFSIKQVVGSAVAPTNLAFAYAQCSDCRTVAVAIQIVLVQSDSHYTAPQNQAVAINYQCNACQTLAFAYQFVIQAGYPVHITDRGMEMIERIYGQILRLGHDKDLSFDQLQSQLKALVQQLQTALSDPRNVAPKESRPPDQNNQNNQGGQDNATPAPTASTHAASPSPTGSSTSSSPSPSATAVASATPGR